MRIVGTIRVEVDDGEGSGLPSRLALWAAFFSMMLRGIYNRFFAVEHYRIGTVVFELWVLVHWSEFMIERLWALGFLFGSLLNI